MACVAVSTKWGLEELFDCEFIVKITLVSSWFQYACYFCSKNNERSVDQLIKYMIDVAMGMHYIMERGLVHRVSYVYTPNSFTLVNKIFVSHHDSDIARKSSKG